MKGQPALGLFLVLEIQSYIRIILDKQHLDVGYLAGERGGRRRIARTPKPMITIMMMMTTVAAVVKPPADYVSLHYTHGRQSTPAEHDGWGQNYRACSPMI